MGGLFSSTTNENASVYNRGNHQAEQEYYEQLRRDRARQVLNEQTERFWRQKQIEEAKEAERLRIIEDKNWMLRRFEESNRKRVCVDYTLFNLWTDAYYNTNIVVHYVTLPDTHSEYMNIKRLISNKKNFKVDRIDKIENPLLKKAYELKKEQKRRQFPYQLQEREMFHGTKSTVVDTICTFNFDWRSVKEHKFGKGISFSSNSTYASVYSDKCYDKVMLVARVLIGKSCPGNKFMEIPSDEFDTSMKSTQQAPQCNDIVTVKYDDSEFYPAYKIHYHLVVDNPPRKSGNSRNARSK